MYIRHKNGQINAASQAKPKEIKSFLIIEIETEHSTLQVVQYGKIVDGILDIPDETEIAEIEYQLSLSKAKEKAIAKLKNERSRVILYLYNEAYLAVTQDISLHLQRGAVMYGEAQEAFNGIQTYEQAEEKAIRYAIEKMSEEFGFTNFSGVAELQEVRDYWLEHAHPVMKEKYLLPDVDYYTSEVFI